MKYAEKSVKFYSNTPIIIGLNRGGGGACVAAKSPRGSIYIINIAPQPACAAAVAVAPFSRPRTTTTNQQLLDYTHAHIRARALVSLHNKNVR